MRVSLVLLMVLLVGFSLQGSSSPIKNVVVLMMENRSFDHMLGWLHQVNPDIDGLTGSEYNSLDASDPSSPKVYVNQHGFDVAPDDPNHDFNSTTEQIFGFHKPSSQRALPKMDGFVQNAYNSNLNTTNIMSMFTKEMDSAPIINHLALEFTVFDKWYASLPGPTDPNRGYVMSGTSNGMVTNWNGTLWSQQSYFNFLTQHNVTWRGYYQMDPWALFYFQDTNTPQALANLHHFERFYSDAKSGSLAQFTFLQPKMDSVGTPPDWQHPDASVKEGERLIKHVYEALRSSPQWEQTAFVLMYDEHGGFYDHVTPPQVGVPSPDNVKSVPDGFNFDRLGIRIPVVLISPWVPKGNVEHRARGPQITSQYDHTSVMATCNKIFGIQGHLTQRDAWAGTFEHLFSEPQARTDCPERLMDLPPWTQQDLEDQWRKPLNDHMSLQIAFYCKFNQRGSDCGKNITNQLEASLFLRREAAIYMDKIRQSGSQ